MVECANFNFTEKHEGAMKMKGSDGLQAAKLICIQLLDVVNIAAIHMHKRTQTHTQ